MSTDTLRLFHVSEEPDIEIFVPRPSPSHFEAVTSDVVFAISERLLHNYLLPRECPRVTYYAASETSAVDRSFFLPNSSLNYVVAVESSWITRIESTSLYCYELPTDHFALIDKVAGYYASAQSAIPISVRTISNPLTELRAHSQVELRVLDDLHGLADAVKNSTLNFSIIRMRNATPKARH